MIVQLTSPKWTGRITLVYELNTLAEFGIKGLAIEGEMSLIQHEYFCEVLKAAAVIDDSTSFGAFEVHKVADGKELLDYSANELIRKKVATFCAIYKAVNGIQYQVTPVDSTMLRRNKQVNMTDDLVRIFLTEERWWSKSRYTIENYVRNYNTLLLMQQGVDKGGAAMPTKYDPAYEKALEGTKLSEYWAALNAAGWKPVKHEVSQKVVAWRSDVTGETINKY